MIAEFKQVQKLFKGQEGLQHADFTLEAGQVIGLFGLNGAGKSTTLKLLSVFYFRTMVKRSPGKSL